MAPGSPSPSIVSVEPAVARHIIGRPGDTATPPAPARNPTAAGVKKTAGTDKRARKQRSQDERRGAEGATASQKSVGRPRNNSLRHVKNSQELLRERSVKRSGGGSIDAHAASKEGRNFTVGNVGTGGLIYLRPSTNQSRTSAQPLPLVFAPLTPPQTASLEADGADGDHRQSVWSMSQLSDRLAWPYQSPPAANATTAVWDADRRYSLASIENHARDDGEAPDGTLRIVINRSAGRPARPVKRLTKPTLEVPIPHYRIGTPRFSTQGTPILRSSTYSRASGSVAHAVRAFTPANPKLLFPVRHSSYPQDSRTRPVSEMPPPHAPPPAAPAPARHTLNSGAQSPAPPRPPRAPADDALFDRLVHMQDDPSVVRYAPHTGDIVAATPARIVAQISSASFMDYDLVSDFFLTFRSYLAATEVLDLLLARLRWAINRWHDDGRIIRIRTFAALRHWILNYFMDDFVGNRPLRAAFCDQINDMYRTVQQRQGGGTSDRKILQDLKRCWNGRCSLYWNAADFVVDSHQEADIAPGGGSGRPNSSLTGPSLPGEPRAPTASPRGWDGPPPPPAAHALRRRHESATTAAADADGPVSIGSEKSLQPISCSIPTKSLRRSPRLPNGTKEPHPVPSHSRRPLSPASAPAETPHPASTHSQPGRGSAADSARDRHSGQASTPDVIFLPPHAGSLIRGNVIPPGSPYVDVGGATAPKPPDHRARPAASADPAASAPDGLGIHMTANGGVKTFIGSIRRALSTRQTGTGPASGCRPGPRSQSVQEGKKSTLPLNVARSNDALRPKGGGAAPSRTPLRIDLLCAAISHSYHAAHDQMRPLDMAAPLGVTEGSEWERSLARPDPAAAAPASHELDPPLRLPSTGTARSGSIVIVDDTGLDIPTMSGALPVPAPALHAAPSVVPSTSHSLHLTLPSLPSASQRSSGVFARRRSSSVDTGLRTLGHASVDAAHRQSTAGPHPALAHRSQAEHARKHESTATTTTAIRRSASSDHDMRRRDAGDGRGPMAPPWSDPTDGPGSDTSLPSHTLRRRPGGDLRQVETVHDLDPSSRPLSIESAASDSDSGAGSLVIMAHPPHPAQPGARPGAATGSVSLIHTHSSQHLRPSFEAAVSGFSTIPDDDDGGLEATLLKLEGRYEKRSPNTDDDDDEFPPPPPAPHHHLHHLHHPPPPASPRDDALHQPNPGPSPDAPDPPHARATHSWIETAARRSVIYGLPTESVDGSDDSDDSLPVLERRVRAPPAPRPAVSRAQQPPLSMPRPLFDSRNATGQPPAESSHPSMEMVDETASMRDMPPGATMPRTDRSPTVHSFLLDADENLSDLSSELSVDIINYADVVARNPSPLLAAPGTAVSGLEIPTHPLAHPPSPSFTLHRLATPQTVHPMMFQQPPLTPDPSPTQLQQPFSPIIHPAAKDAPAAAPSPARVSASPGHLPWLLACDAELVAEQMTLVEKAALSEIEWSDLVNMHGDHAAAATATAPLNWVDFLAAGDHKGIDVVISRFNMMVKWVRSEVVLTHNVHERAQTIMKYIHVAAHARRLHNYATMLQITMALTSTDCSRLRRTWDLVHPPERSLLKNMEALMQPLRNFHDLRVEMETADLTEGCIPFVGLYIHDLTYNAQKPAQIANAPGQEPLINFERHRTTAAIVKGLLRLIDASSRLNFPPVDGVLDRCVWIAALSDEKISALSKDLEP